MTTTQEGQVPPKSDGAARRARAPQRAREHNRLLAVLLAVVPIFMFAFAIAFVIWFHIHEAGRVLPGI